MGRELQGAMAAVLDGGMAWAAATLTAGARLAAASLAGYGGHNRRGPATKYAGPQSVEVRRIAAAATLADTGGRADGSLNGGHGASIAWGCWVTVTFGPMRARGRPIGRTLVVIGFTKVRNRKQLSERVPARFAPSAPCARGADKWDTPLKATLASARARWPEPK